MILFRFLLVIDALAAVVVLYFFVEGVRDGTVSAGNILLWLALLVLPIATLMGGLRLRSRGRTGLASLVLLPVALPALSLGLFLLLMIVMPPDFR